MPTPLPPKKEVMLALLERSSVFIHLDPRSDSVRVPPWFKKQAQLVLQVGLNMAVPIPDLSVDDDAVSCTLSFSRAAHFCYVPWKAIFALVGDDSRGMVWPNDIPPEVAAQGAQRKPDAEKPRLKAIESSPAEPSGARVSGKKRGSGKSRKKRPSLSAVPSPKAEGGPELAAAGPPADTAAEKPNAPVPPDAPAALPAEDPAAASRKPKPAAEDANQKAGEQPAGKSKLPPYLRIVK